MLPEHSIEARRLLDWSQSRLASAADVALPAVVAFEASGPSAADVIVSIEAALQAAGIELVAENGGGGEVRLRKKL